MLLLRTITMHAADMLVTHVKKTTTENIFKMYTPKLRFHKIHHLAVSLRIFLSETVLFSNFKYIICKNTTITRTLRCHCSDQH